MLLVTYYVAFSAFVYVALSSNVTCDDQTECIIDCSSWMPCAGRRIDGSNAKSLTVMCNSANYLGASDGYSGCKGTQIMCPYDSTTQSGASCTVLCTNPNIETKSRPAACENTVISSNANGKLDYLNVTCAGTKSCKGLNIYAPSWRKSNTNIQCTTHSDGYGESEDACSDMVVHAAYVDSVDNWLHLQCDKNQCDGLQVRCGENGAKTMSKMTYNEGTEEYECDDSQCCPLSNTDTMATSEPILNEESSEKNEEIKVSGEMIALVFLSVLLVIMCVVSGCLMLKLQKERQQKETGAGFVSLDA